MRSGASFLAVIVLFSACTPARPPEGGVEVDPNVEVSLLAPAAEAAQDHVVVTRDRIRATNALVSAGMAVVDRFARTSGEERLVPVPDSAEWPSETEVSYTLVSYQQGQVLAWIETPVSQSGDWFNEVVHHFGPEGRTVAIERSSSFFNGCPKPAREHSLTFYGRTGDVIAREYTLTDFDGGMLEPEQCGFLYRLPYRVFGGWGEIARAYAVRR